MLLRDRVDQGEERTGASAGDDGSVAADVGGHSLGAGWSEMRREALLGQEPIFFFLSFFFSPSWSHQLDSYTPLYPQRHRKMNLEGALRVARV